MKYFFLALLFVVPDALMAEYRDKIAVIDTGASSSVLNSAYACSEGHVDLSGHGLQDTNGHGTMVALELVKGVNPLTQCLMIVKWADYSVENLTGEQEADRVARSIRWATIMQAKYINISLGGQNPNDKEKKALEQALDQGAVVVVAAGNEDTNLSFSCNYYPACYSFKSKRFFVVANYRGRERSRGSNYGGPVNAKEYGGFPGGTSKATAIFMSKYVRGVYEKKCTDSCPVTRKLRP